MEKKNVILLTVVAVATLLVTVIGATFAWFTANVTGEGTEMSVKSVNVEGLNITYNDGKALEATNIIPGWGVTYGTNANTKTIEVTNESGYDIEYTLKWKSVSNTFDETDKKNLTFSATAVTAWVEPSSHPEQQPTTAVQPEGGVCPDTSYTGEFVKQTLKNGEKITYTLKLAYAEANAEQNSQGASFSGIIDLADKDVKIVNAGA